MAEHGRCEHPLNSGIHLIHLSTQTVWSTDVMSLVMKQLHLEDHLVLLLVWQRCESEANQLLAPGLFIGGECDWL